MLAWLLGAVSLAVYLVLRQRSFYGADGFFLEHSLRADSFTNTSHEAFLPLLHAFAAAVAWTGIPAHAVLTSLSALGTAMGVILTLRTVHLVVGDRARATAAAALVAATPAVLFFATAVEYHGCFFAFAQLALLAAAAFAKRPSRARAVALGLAMAVATSVHTSGWFLPLVLVPFVAAQVGRGGVASAAAALRASRRGCVVALAVFVLAELTVTWGARRAGIGVPPPFGIDYVWSHLGSVAVPRLLQVPRTLLFEWVLPFAPLSLVALLLVRSTTAATTARAALLGVVLYCVPAAEILAGEIWERGAYLLPCVGPVAVAAAQALRARTLLLLALFGGAFGVAQVVFQERLTDEYATVAAWACDAAAGARPVLLVAEPVDWGAAVVHAGRLDHVQLESWKVRAGVSGDAEIGEAIRAWLRAESGLQHAPLVSARALAALARSADGRKLAHALRSAGHLEPVAAAGIEGFRLRPW
ncbi:MAG: hypothetical protein R3F56_02825 [Planctomycetota bacterium]